MGPCLVTLNFVNYGNNLLIIPLERIPCSIHVKIFRFYSDMLILCHLHNLAVNRPTQQV